MAMRECGGCGTKVRKRQNAFVIGKGMTNVCAECASWGLLVVAMRHQRPAAVRVEVERPPEKILALLKTRLRGAKSLAALHEPRPGEESDNWNRAKGSIEAIEDAIAIVEGKVGR